MVAIKPSTPNFGPVTELQPQFDQQLVLPELKPWRYSETCCLNILPTIFFKTVLASLDTDVLKIVNTSTLWVTLPRLLKTATMKLLLKERSLDPSVSNNYRPTFPLLEKWLIHYWFRWTTSYIWQNHSTETALIKVWIDIIWTVVQGNTSSGAAGS